MTPLEVAKTQIGKEENPKGSNKGPEVDQYLKSVGLNPGFSWCMAFVYWCAKEAGKESKLVKTGGVMRQWNESPKTIKYMQPLPGDIFIMDFGKGLGHTGFVESIDGDLMVTIEGNATSISGSREGYAVVRKTTRRVSQCKGFIRI